MWYSIEANESSYVMEENECNSACIQGVLLGNLSSLSVVLFCRDKIKSWKENLKKDIKCLLLDVSGQGRWY